jgi:hypothetical protein
MAKAMVAARAGATEKDVEDAGAGVIKVASAEAACGA